MKRDADIAGFSLVTALFLLVILAALGVFVITIGSTQQATSTLSILDARAMAAAESGLEWAVHRARNQPADLGCGGAGATFNLQGPGLDGFSVGISCVVTPNIVEGAAPPYSMYALTVTASRGVTGSPDYVRRILQATVTDAP